MSDLTRKERRNIRKETLRMLAANTVEHNVGKSAAALAFYLLFALFPLLIFLSNLLGLLHLDVTSVLSSAQQFLPKDVMSIVESYLEHVSKTSSRALLSFSLVFTVWFPMRAAGGLMDSVRMAYHLGRPARPVIYALRKLAYTVVLLFVIGLAFLLSVLGKRTVAFLGQLLPMGAALISGHFLTLWQYLRFVPIGALMFAALAALYAASLDRRQGMEAIRPGVLVSLTAWLVISICFSFYVEHFASYSIIYGTLGAVIVLIMWLYITAYILILGAELNAALQTVRNNNR